MKKTIAAVALTLVSTVASAGTWIYSGTGFKDVDQYAHGALNKAYLPVVEAVYGRQGSIYANGSITYKESTGQCVTFFSVIAALDTMEGGGEVTVFHDSPVQRVMNYSENISGSACVKQFNKTIDENFESFKKLLSSNLPNKY